jgi:hypothetical protein
MKLTKDEIEYTRQVAAEIGRDPNELITEGEQIKEDGYRRAYEASAEAMSHISGTGMQAYGASPSARLATVDPSAEREMEAGG